MQARRLLNVDRVEKWFARAFTKDLRPAAVAVTVNSPGEGHRLPPRRPSRICTPDPGRQTLRQGHWLIAPRPPTPPGSCIRLTLPSSTLPMQAGLRRKQS